MNRTIVIINPDKWYHFETLKKFYNNYKIREIKQESPSGKIFEFIVFERLWQDRIFVVHPKHKRLRLNTPNTLDELGWENVAIE